MTSYSTVHCLLQVINEINRAGEKLVRNDGFRTTVMLYHAARSTVELTGVEGTSRAAIEDGDIICLQHSHPRIVPQTPFSLSLYISAQ
jgi:hypothetical protein